MITRLEDKELKRQNRRQLLKLAPVAVLGVFAFPRVCLPQGERPAGFGRSSF